MAKFKELYVFDVYKNVEVEETEVVTQDGQEVKVTKKVKKDVPVKVGIKKPTRAEADEAELFYNVKFAEGIKAGLMTKALMAKRINNDGGFLSEQEKEEYSKAYFNAFSYENELQRALIKDEALRTDEEKENIKDLILKIKEAKRLIQDVEAAQSAIFENCSENRARAKTIMWWILFMSYFQNEKGEWTPFFNGQTFEEKIAVLDEIEENDALPEEQKAFYAKSIQKLSSLVSLWYYGVATTKEDFDKYLSEEKQ